MKNKTYYGVISYYFVNEPVHAEMFTVTKSATRPPDLTLNRANGHAYVDWYAHKEAADKYINILNSAYADGSDDKARPLDKAI